MKKLILTGLLTICFAFLLVGCGGDKNNSATEPTGTPQATDRAVATETPKANDDSDAAADDKTDAGDNATDDDDSVSDGIKNGTDKVGDGVKDAVDGVVDGADDMIDGAVDGIDDATDGATG